MPDILDQIDAATYNLCMCGCRTPLDPDGPSAYYIDAAHQQGWMRDQTTRPSEVHGTEFVDPDQMRWRPDLVTDADDSNLIALGSETVGYTGHHHAQVFERTDRPETWHLRLDDGHRYVGADLAEVGGRQDPVTAELEARIKEAWRRLERELGNTRHLVADDPWSDVMSDGLCDLPSEREASEGCWPAGVTWQRRCRSCGQHGVPMAERRVVYEFDYLAAATERVEFCDLCPHCRTPFPGPPISASWHLDPLSGWWRLVLRMTAGDNRLKFGYRLLVEELRNSTDPAGFIQRTWDRMEADLLRRVEQAPVINDPRQLHALFGIPIVADPDVFRRDPTT